ncbi:hypothetical protein SAMN05421780_105216 [Flexibacter flexilis DSM 6793]|uniref:Uncharacterized protein n=1 Tax=Flexibacter flexilis DSM 6793 TaxID=927664 RepID=A0A1I1J6W1_9BACT|nr:hypothetical protein [Flexibacter flexilis]SFC43861.1 hypothetical protein SAMN05421780_105216 [Flexibacter flexilis DSM 6793]
MQNLELTEQIEAYLEGQLSQAERHAFELEMAQNADLKNEVHLQEQAARLVRAGAAMQLKTELGQMHEALFGQAAMQKARQQFWAKIVGGGLLLSAVAIWYFWPKSEPNILPEPLKKPVPVVVQPPKTELPLVAETPVKNTENEIVTENKKPVTIPNIHKKSERKTAKRKPMAVVNDNAKYAFHYRFHEGQLTLFGKFDQQQADFRYDRQGQQYLAHGHEFYKLSETGGKVLPLKPVTDASILAQLLPQQNTETQHIDKGFLGTTSQLGEGLEERFVNKNTANNALKLASGVVEVTPQTLLNTHNPNYDFHYQFDDTFLTLYGAFGGVNKKVVRNAEDQYFLILTDRNEIYELEKTDSVRPLRKLKKKYWKKVVLVPEEEEL